MFKQTLNVEFDKLPIMTYEDAMYYYGCDKPDTRNPLKFIDLTAHLQNSSFKVFHDAANMTNHRIVALNLPDTASLSRKEIDEYTEFVVKYGAKGLAYIKVNDITNPDNMDLQSPITKFLTKEDITAILSETKAKNGDTILIIADSIKVVNDSMGALRLKLGIDKKLLTKDWSALWVIDFPLFEYDADSKTYQACHHPFTSPKDEHIDMLQTNPKACLAKAYDLVLNGSEIGGGSVRIYNSQIQSKVFDAMGISKEEAQDKFGFLLENLQN